MERYSQNKHLNDSPGKDPGIMPSTSKPMLLHPSTLVYTPCPQKRRKSNANSSKPTYAYFKYAIQNPPMPADSFSSKRKTGNFDQFRITET